MKSNKLFVLVLQLLEKISVSIHETYIVSRIFIFNYKYFKKNKVTRRSVYIDCGSNLGQGYDFFSRYFPISNFDHVLVEPNPFCVKVLKDKYLKNSINKTLSIIGKAADVKDGSALFYGLNNVNKGEYSDGASIQEFHNSALYTLDKDDAIEVETFDFSSFINDCHNKYEKIVVKMDIEGSEYGILNKLLEDGNAKHIDLIFVEFHSAYMVDKQKHTFSTLEKDLINSFRKLGVEFYIWR